MKHAAKSQRAAKKENPALETLFTLVEYNKGNTEYVAAFHVFLGIMHLYFWL